MSASNDGLRVVNRKNEVEVTVNFTLKVIRVFSLSYGGTGGDFM